MDVIKNLCAAAEARDGVDAKVELKVSQVKALLATMSEQEREILGMERSHESFREKVQSLVENLDCYDFSEHLPSDEYDNDVFEVFVGTVSDHGRIFAIWDSASSSFHEPIVEDGQIFYREDVVYWRYSLPEPHESLDLGEEV